MKAAIVTAPGKNPIHADFRDPVAAAGEELISVAAAALTHLTKGRASGSHYSASGDFPAVVGVDGVGRTQDGRRVYFVLPDPPFGGMAERVPIKKELCVPLPDDVADVTAAAIANPGMSCWVALRERARLVAGETVLINGATGSGGRVAVQIAKYMGAKKVIATGREAGALKQLKALGADVTIQLTAPREALEKELEEQFSSRVDVVIDYLWGPSAEAVIYAAARASQKAVPVRFIQVGSVSRETITLPAAVLRSSALVMMGSGLGSVPLKGLIDAIGGVMQAVVPGKLQIETEVVPLRDVEAAWNKDSSRSRIVFVVG
jgi:NADPH:quinone reductase-like Zn-dependent oxidoreductase